MAVLVREGTRELAGVCDGWASMGRNALVLALVVYSGALAQWGVCVGLACFGIIGLRCLVAGSFYGAGVQIC